MIKAFVIKHWKTIAIFSLIAGLILFNVHLYREAAMAKKKEEVAQHNLAVAQDSIRIVKDKAGRIEYQKLAYLTDKLDNLEKLNTNLANEVKQIKGKVSTIIQGEVKIVEKPVPFLVKGELVDSTVTAHFNYDTTYSEGNYRKLAGYTQYDLRNGSATGKKLVDETGIKFTTGIKDLDKGKPEIFLKSNYPGFSVTSLEGAVLDPKLFQPKKKTPLITPSITIGWTPIQWDSKDQAVKVQPKNFGVTVGAGFNILKLIGVKK